MRLFVALALSGAPMKAPDPISPIATVLVGAAFLFVLAYGIYCKILKQMAINAKNKRIIKNELPTG